jgi:hypothetical protein
MDTSWEDKIANIIGPVWGFVFDVLNRNAAVVMGLSTVAALIVIGYLLKLLFQQAYVGVKWIWYRTRQKCTVIYHRVRKFFRTNPWTRRAGEIIMAKWEKSLVADILGDALYKAWEEGKLSDSQYRRHSDIVGKLGYPDLIRPRYHPKALRAHFMGDGKHPPKYQKLAGPKQNMKAGGPPALHIPSVEEVRSNIQFLNKLKERKAA